jgi:transposase
MWSRSPVRVTSRSPRSPGVSGSSQSCLARWLKIADREDGLAAGPPAAGEDSAELRELRKRNRQLEQENEILRRAAAYVARDVLPR